MVTLLSGLWRQPLEGDAHDGEEYFSLMTDVKTAALWTSGPSNCSSSSSDIKLALYNRSRSVPTVSQQRPSVEDQQNELSAVEALSSRCVGSRSAFGYFQTVFASFAAEGWRHQVQPKTASCWRRCFFHKCSRFHQLWISAMNKMTGDDWRIVLFFFLFRSSSQDYFYPLVFCRSAIICTFSFDALVELYHSTTYSFVLWVWVTEWPCQMQSIVHSNESVFKISSLAN